MEKIPEFRIIGGSTEEQKEVVRREKEKALFNHFDSLPPEELAQFKKFEYPKSEKEISLIDFANIETDELMQQAGVEPYDIPLENFHIIPPELYKKAAGDTGTATTFNSKQGIIFDAQHFRDNPLNFAATALHETLHLKAHFSLEVEQNPEDKNKIETTPYREGVTIRALQKYGHHGQYHAHFNGLHEAIVATQEQKSLPKILNLPEFAEEKEWLQSEEAKELRKKLAKEKNIPEDDIIWVGKKGKNDWEKLSYLQPKRALDYVCSEIQKQFPDKYNSPDEVFKEFLKAHFTGQLLPIARLIEKTFGEGSFRILGNMDASRDSGVMHLESLKKMRMRQIKNLVNQTTGRQS